MDLTVWMESTATTGRMPRMYRMREPTVASLALRDLPDLKDQPDPRECVECAELVDSPAIPDAMEIPACPERWDLLDHPELTERSESPDLREMTLRSLWDDLDLVDLPESLDRKDLLVLLDVMLILDPVGPLESPDNRDTRELLVPMERRGQWDLMEMLERTPSTVSVLLVRMEDTPDGDSAESTVNSKFSINILLKCLILGSKWL